MAWAGLHGWPCQNSVCIARQVSCGVTLDQFLVYSHLRRAGTVVCRCVLSADTPLTAGQHYDVSLAGIGSMQVFITGLFSAGPGGASPWPYNHVLQHIMQSICGLCNPE